MHRDATAGRRACAWCVALALLAAPSAALAWNARGHRIVARAAEARLDAEARGAARALLDGAHLADVAGWADAESREDATTRRWHWVNIGAEDGGYDARRHCADGDCVVARIEELARRLADRGAAPQERARALRFLVHLVPDLHQPLHAGRPEDRGGNRIPLALPSGGVTNLHHAYDDLPDGCGLPRKERAAARIVGDAVSPADARAWAVATPADWATESHLLARHAYAAVVPGRHGAPGTLPPDAGRRCAMMRARLAQASVRLAALLTAALRADAAAPRPAAPAPAAPPGPAE